MYCGTLRIDTNLPKWTGNTSYFMVRGATEIILSYGLAFCFMGQSDDLSPVGAFGCKGRVFLNIPDRWSGTLVLEGENTRMTNVYAPGMVARIRGKAHVSACFMDQLTVLGDALVRLSEMNYLTINTTGGVEINKCRIVHFNIRTVEGDVTIISLEAAETAEVNTETGNLRGMGKPKVCFTTTSGSNLYAS